MINFDIRLFLEVVVPLNTLRQHVLDSATETKVVDHELGTKVVDLYEHFVACGLTLTADFALEVAEALMRGESGKFVAGQIHIFNQVLIREFSAKAIMMLPSERAKYNGTPQKLFGHAVCTAYPSAVDDLEEAAKCLSFGRSTAGVFHLMRVTEAGLKSLGTALGIPYAPSWEAYITQIGNRVAAKHKTKAVRWKKDEPYFKEILGDLQAIKLAWRNPLVSGKVLYEKSQVLSQG
jgi:hypothetical protein